MLMLLRKALEHRIGLLKQQDAAKGCKSKAKRRPPKKRSYVIRRKEPLTAYPFTHSLYFHPYKSSCDDDGDEKRLLLLFFAEINSDAQVSLLEEKCSP